MNRQLVSLLRRADLREEEILVYKTLLKKNPATISEIQSETGLSTPMTYRIVNQMIDRSLVEGIEINKKQRIFKPCSLKSLISVLQKEQMKLRKIELALQKLDPVLASVSSDDALADESVEIIDSLEGFHEEYLSLPELGGEEFLAIGSSDHFWKASQSTFDSPLERSFVSRRLKNNMYSRSMMVETEDSRKIADSDTKEKRTTKLKKSLPVTTDMLMICGDQVSHFVCDIENPHVIRMKHPELVALHKRYFAQLWDQ